MLAGPLCGQITLAALRGTIKRAAPCSLLCWQGAALLRCYIYDWQLSEAGMPVEGERAKESTSWVDTVCVRVCVYSICEGFLFVLPLIMDSFAVTDFSSTLLRATHS